MIIIIITIPNDNIIGELHHNLFIIWNSRRVLSFIRDTATTVYISNSMHRHSFDSRHSL